MSDLKKLDNLIEIETKMKNDISYINLGLYSIQFFLSLYILCLVTCVRKQRVVFIVGIPLCFMISAFAQVFNELDSIAELDLDTPRTFLTAINNFSFPFAQWLFGLQYLQTSLILPKLLINGRANALISKIRTKLF